ncbi:MAG: nucleotidyltransferase family protein, partial [Solirubrobacteraceae bacterium]
MAECADPIAALAALVQRAWLVGGAVRDHVLGRPTADFDVVVDASVREVARKLGLAAGGFSFELSHSFGAWRVVARDRSWQVDLTPLDGDTIDDDLA